MTVTIRAKLLAAFGISALFTGALGWYTLSAHAAMNDDQRTLYEDVFGGAYLLATFVNQSGTVRRSVTVYL